MPPSGKTASTASTVTTCRPCKKPVMVCGCGRCIVTLCTVTIAVKRGSCEASPGKAVVKVTVCALAVKSTSRSTVTARRSKPA